MIAAYTLQVSQVFIFLRGEFALGLERVQAALNDAYAHGAVDGTSSARGSRSTSSSIPAPGPTSAARRRRSSSRSRASAGAPHQAPVLPGGHRPLRRPDRGQQRRDHVQPAVELLNGGAAFAALGGGRSTGTRLFALAGQVHNPGVYELEMVKTTFRDLINAPVWAGHPPRPGTQGDHPRRGVRTVVRSRASRPPLGQDEVGKPGTMLGSGSVVVMDDPTCAVRAAWRITRFSRASPAASARRAARARAGWRRSWSASSGPGREEDLDLLMDACDNISPGVAWPPQQTTICVLGPSIPSSISSAIRMFRDEFLVHIKEGGCPYG